MLKSLSIALVLTTTVVFSSQLMAQEIPQGNWTITTLELGGKPLPLPMDTKVVISKDKLLLQQAGKTLAEYTYKTDTTKNPKWIDLTYERQVSTGIYELKDDVLKIVTAGGGAIRSTSFDTKNAAATDMLMVFKLVK